MPLADLAVAEDVALLHQLMHQLHAAVVIPGQVIAVGEVERVDIPIIRLVALLDDLQCQLIRRRNLRAATLSLVEELFLSDLSGLGMVADEHDMHVIVLRAQETYHPEVEASCYVFLEFSHATRYIHHRQYY